ncbi:SDR family NAD(P)-dependent oxidoreductase [Desulfogranum mediterraneum]|uniref:SDR family NAD(P)-dependent oxidoreductase n=1 Tax=Desulfogranum mediterraneum TaxID=160661 RepID=UPI0004213467|nr:SDR family oxidoreductase [Desulfogranum mediterraneum]
MNISGKIALVLGGSRGIGLAIATSLAARGARLVLPWFDWPEASAAMCRTFSGDDNRHCTIQADLRRSEDILRLVEQIETRFGRLDILVNNIERGGMPIIHGSYHRSINRQQWQLEMETTLHAKWQVFEQCLPLLKKSREGAVVNLSSIAALTGRSGPAGLLFNDGYAAANRGIQSLTQTWARLCAPDIRVNEIMLGLFETRHGPGTRGWGELAASQQEELIAHTLLGRTGRAEEVVATLLFLLEGATFMTGSTIRLDGGYLLGGEEVPEMPAGVI